MFVACPAWLTVSQVGTSVLALPPTLYDKPRYLVPCARRTRLHLASLGVLWSAGKEGTEGGDSTPYFRVYINRVAELVHLPFLSFPFLSLLPTTSHYLLLTTKPHNHHSHFFFRDTCQAYI